MTALSPHHSTRPLVSVIVPAYNAEAYLAESLDSALAQTYPNLEVVVVNDGSTDGTTDILQSYGDRIKVVHQSNQGLPAARNAGIAASRGEWLAFLDSDDLWDPEKIQRQAEHFRPGVDVIHSDCRLIGKDGRVFKESVAAFHTPGCCELANLLVRNAVFVLTAVVRRSAIEAVGRFDTRARRGCEDWQLWLKLAARRAGFACLREPLASYRVHDNNMSCDTERMLEARRYVLATFREQYGGRLNRRERAAWRYRMFRTCYDLGYARYKQGRFTPARQAFVEALHAKPFHVLTWLYAFLTGLPNPHVFITYLQRIRHSSWIHRIWPVKESSDD